MGKEQLMLLLGAKADSGQSSCRNVPIKSSDVVILGMEVQSSWTGQIIAELITANLKARSGVNVLQFVYSQQHWIEDCLATQLFETRQAKRFISIIRELRRWFRTQPATLSRVNQQRGAISPQSRLDGPSLRINPLL